MRKLVLATLAATVLSSGAALAQGVPPSVLRNNQIQPDHALIEPSPYASGKTGWFANLLGLGHGQAIASAKQGDVANNVGPTVER